MAKLSPFDFIKSINDKSYLMVDPEIEKQYLPFVVNRGFSQHVDCVPYVHFLNTHPDLDHKMQYDYLYHGIRKVRRYGKWAKADNHEYLDDVVATYHVNKQEAMRIIERLTAEQLEMIRKKLNAFGGRNALMGTK